MPQAAYSSWCYLAIIHLDTYVFNGIIIRPKRCFKFDFNIRCLITLYDAWPNLEGVCSYNLTNQLRIHTFSLFQFLILIDFNSHQTVPLKKSNGPHFRIKSTQTYLLQRVQGITLNRIQW